MKWLLPRWAAPLACRAWEVFAWHQRKRHHFLPWTSEQLAEYLDATERYSKQASTALARGDRESERAERHHDR